MFVTPRSKRDPRKDKKGPMMESKWNQDVEQGSQKVILEAMKTQFKELRTDISSQNEENKIKLKIILELNLLRSFPPMWLDC